MALAGLAGLPNATVERVSHLLTDDRHCVYRISPAEPVPASETATTAGRATPDG